MDWMYLTTSVFFIETGGRPQPTQATSLATQTTNALVPVSSFVPTFFCLVAEPAGEGLGAEQMQ